LSTKPGPKLPDKKTWNIYRRWKDWPEPPPAWHVDNTKPPRKERKNGR